MSVNKEQNCLKLKEIEELQQIQDKLKNDVAFSFKQLEDIRNLMQTGIEDSQEKFNDIQEKIIKYTNNIIDIQNNQLKHNNITKREVIVEDEQEEQIISKRETIVDAFKKGLFISLIISGIGLGLGIFVVVISNYKEIITHLSNIIKMWGT